MDILDKRTDFNFQFTYPAVYNGTASGILVMLGDTIVLEWTPAKLAIEGRYNITMSCNG